MRKSRRWLGMSGMLCLLALSACSRGDEPETPVQVLLSFLSSIERSAQEPDFRKQAFARLDRASRQQLEERAALARSLAGHGVEGWEMLTPGRLTVPTRELSREALRAVVEGDRATIEVREGAEVPLVREDGHWRIKLFP